MDFTKIPSAMKAANRGLNHRADKVPCDKAGKPIDATNPANHLSFEEAVAACLASAGSLGLGFALGADGTGSYWQGIDLDKIDENGLQGLAAKLLGYVERSLSGRGIYAIGYGGWFPAKKRNGIEAYCEKQYFTVTCNAIRGWR